MQNKIFNWIIVFEYFFCIQIENLWQKFVFYNWRARVYYGAVYACLVF